MNPPAFLRAQGDTVLLFVKAQPRASRTAIAGVLGGELKIKVAAPPVEGAANEALIGFLAEVLARPRRDVTLLRGASTAHKTFALHGVPLEEAVRKLAPD